jgi:hypothetical protein
VAHPESRIVAASIAEDESVGKSTRIESEYLTMEEDWRYRPFVTSINQPRVRTAPKKALIMA